MFKLNQKGMTLVETMVAAGLLGGLAVAGMTLFKTQNKAQKTVEQNYEVTATLGAIRSILADMTNCKLTLGGQLPVHGGPGSPNGQGITKRVNGVDTVLYQRNTMLPGTSLRISTYSLSQSYPGLAPNETMLEIVFSRGNNVQTDLIRKTVKINFTLDVSTGTVIDDCYAVTSGHSDSLWQIVGVTDDIFYPVGNVGIGTSTPAANFHVQNGGPLNVFFDKIDSNTWGATIGLRKARGTPGTPAAVINGDQLANITARGHDGTAFSTASGAIRMTATQNWTNSAQGTNMTFLTTPNGGTAAASLTERMRIDSNGNVGIRTTTPNNSLHVFTSGAATGVLVQSDTNMSALSFRDSGTGTNPQVVSHGNDLYLQTAGSERMRVTQAGRVGINTAAPDGLLHVEGGGNAWPATSGTSQTGLMFRLSHSGGSTLDFGINAGPAWIQGTNKGNLAATFPLILNPNGGNVGVGTTNPVGKLEVSGTSEATSNLIINNRGSAPNNIKMQFRSGATDLGQISTRTPDGSSGDLEFWTSNAGTLNREMVIKANGNVGIGTIDPQTELHVAGVNLPTLRLHNLGSNFWDIGNSDNSGTNNNLRFFWGMNEHFTFTTLGRLGIGVPAPTQMLHVSGNVLASSYLYSSDKRLKEKIIDLQSPLKRVLALRGHSFTWKESGKSDIGFVAQEVKAVEPSLVEGDGEDYLSVKYGNITALLVEAIKEVKAMIDSLFANDKKLEEELAVVKAKNAELEARLEKQESLIQRILDEKKK